MEPNRRGDGQLIRCWGKACYLSWAQAQRVLRQMLEVRRLTGRWEHRGGVPEPYRCPRCHLWHLGRQEDGRANREGLPRTKPKRHRDWLSEIDEE